MRKIAFVCLLLSSAVHADTIHLKNGRKIENAVIVSRGSELVVRSNGTNIRLPNESVERIERIESPAATPLAVQRKPDPQPDSSKPSLGRDDDDLAFIGMQRQFCLQQAEKGRRVFLTSCANALGRVEALYKGEPVTYAGIQEAMRYLNDEKFWETIRQNDPLAANRLKRLLTGPRERFPREVASLKDEHLATQQAKRESRFRSGFCERFDHAFAWTWTLLAMRAPVCSGTI